MEKKNSIIYWQYYRIGRIWCACIFPHLITRPWTIDLVPVATVVWCCDGWLSIRIEFSAATRNTFQVIDALRHDYNDPTTVFPTCQICSRFYLELLLRPMSESVDSLDALRGSSYRKPCALAVIHPPSVILVRVKELKIEMKWIFHQILVSFAAFQLFGSLHSHINLIATTKATRNCCLPAAVV